jgi:hypothetical protein
MSSYRKIKFNISEAAQYTPILNYGDNNVQDALLNHEAKLARSGHNRKKQLTEKHKTHLEVTTTCYKKRSTRT